MSRTIKTMPPLVIAHDRHALVAHHNHSKGHCDLPPYPDTKTLLADFNKWWRASCRWSYSDTFWYDQRCDCRMCSGYYEHHWENRRSRHTAKLDSREYLKYGND